jgi:hypothetical protein
LRAFENSVLRRRFGPKREELTGGRGKEHNEGPNNSYFPKNIVEVIRSRRMRWAGYVGRIGDMINAYKLLVGKSEGKRSFGMPTLK